MLTTLTVLFAAIVVLGLVVYLAGVTWATAIVVACADGLLSSRWHSSLRVWPD